MSIGLLAPISTFRKCSEMDDNQSLAIATYTKLCGVLPYLIYFRWQSTGLAIECRDADICTGPHAVPNTIPTTIQETKSSGVRQITMPKTLPLTITNTMTITIRNTMPYLFRSYITENTIFNKIKTQTRRSPATQLWRQLTTAIDFRIKLFQSMFPREPYKISRWRSNDFQKRGMPLPETETTPTTHNYRPGCAGTKHHKTHSPIDKASSGKST